MAKYSFIIVGSGWRAEFYIRIAKALSEKFELKALLCRSNEKKCALENKYNIYATTDEQQCGNMNVDFVVVAVTKKDIQKVCERWSSRGFTVLMETPAGQDVKTLKHLWALHTKGHKILVAEQYPFYPMYKAIKKTIDSGIIGNADYASVSLAHEYHGFALIRYFLSAGFSSFKITARQSAFNTTETATRYETITDGRTSYKKRSTAIMEFANGKTALYDFDSEQYRSPIRKNYVKVQGVRGEIHNEKVYYLDADNKGAECSIKIDNHILTADENAIAFMMESAARYNCENDYVPDYSLAQALQDSYCAVCLNKAVKSKKTVKGKVMKWGKSK